MLRPNCLRSLALTRRTVLSLVVLIGLPTALSADDSIQKQSDANNERLLTVGNIFSANATRYLKDLAKARGNLETHNFHGKADKMMRRGFDRDKLGCRSIFCRTARRWGS